MVQRRVRATDHECERAENRVRVNPEPRQSKVIGRQRLGRVVEEERRPVAEPTEHRLGA
jgi:hypothetical protein